MLSLNEKLESADRPADTLTLSFERRQRSRQRVTLDSGREAALMLPPGSHLRHGDLLRAGSGELVEVRAATEWISTARTGDRQLLARAAYHLGNRHIPVQIGACSLHYAHDHVLDDMLLGLGLEVVSEHQLFEPEPGAYHTHAPHDQHAHPPHHRHDGEQHDH